MKFEIGDLVRIKNASFDVPAGTVGLIVGGLVNRVDRDLILYEVQLTQCPSNPEWKTRFKRCFPHDLELVNEGR